VFEFLAAISTE